MLDKELELITAFTFPGQGAQRPGMLGTLPKDSDAQSRVTEAESVLGQDLRELDSPDAFKDSRNVQLALLIDGVVWGEHLLKSGAVIDYVLGMSIGAYPAAVLAGCLRFEDALRLVELRGRLMQRAYPSGYGMLALTGPQQSDVESVVRNQRLAGLDVYLANLNAENQFILSGQCEALRETAAIIRSRVPCSDQLLSVPVPSHCELLRTQAEQLLRAFDRFEVSVPRVKYVSASAARVLYRPDDIRKDLACNMSLQMRWYESSLMLVERGLEQVVEMPPGTALTALFRRIMPGGVCRSVRDAPST